MEATVHVIRSRLRKFLVIKVSGDVIPSIVKENKKLSAYKVSIQVALLFRNILGHMNKKIIFTLSNSNHL